MSSSLSTAAASKTFGEVIQELDLRILFYFEETPEGPAPHVLDQISLILFYYGTLVHFLSPQLYPLTDNQRKVREAKPSAGKAHLTSPQFLIEKQLLSYDFYTVSEVTHKQMNMIKSQVYQLNHYQFAIRSSNLNTRIK